MDDAAFFSSASQTPAMEKGSASRRADDARLHDAIESHHETFVQSATPWARSENALALLPGLTRSHRAI